MTNSFPYSVPIMDAIRHDYERFRLETYQHSHKGLFTDGKKLFAVIPEVKQNKALLNELKEQYYNLHSVGVPYATIVGEELDNYYPIESRSMLEKIQVYGHPMTMGEAINQINIHIPRKYHPFHVQFLFATNEFKLTFKTRLAQSEQQDIRLICESLGHQGYDFTFETNPTISDYPGVVDFKPNTQNNMQLVASGFIQKQFSRELLARYEEDEEFWVQNRQSVFSGDETAQKDEFLLPKFLAKQTRCFVDASVFPRQNLRVYLTLYEQVVIALPLQAEDEHFYKMFNINRHELRELVARGRLLFVVPQNLSRYSQSLLLDIISVDPNAIIFSRRLAAATIKAIQSKTKIMGATFSSDEQYHFLHRCARVNIPEVQKLASILSEQWQFGEFLLDKEGATSAHQLGVSRLAAKSFQERGKDLLIELTSAGSSYEYAQGLGAHHFPFDSNDYSEAAACQVISGLYNGVAKQTKQIRESELSTLLSEILTINNDMDILELDNALSSSLTRSLPNIVKEYANMDESERFQKLKSLEQEVKTIENNKARLSKLNMSGFLGSLAGAGMELTGTRGGGFIALGGWLINALKVYADELKLEENPIFTKLSSLNHFTSKDAIIVQRVRDSVSK
ncbi:hypothetical protein [Idiomarina piscisalsi]|uniref:Uncharacterized protein n=1 Tax=Idiomarina piscisalsi TaxID=1096243 RepID=A0A432YS62_9GAMM|nr:hypothetical protein [Idiomarina piscisalsi]RUO64541.1 hypothetical protein CWI73_07570 [Idiomarina piscisalsi]